MSPRIWFIRREQARHEPPTYNIDTVIDVGIKSSAVFVLKVEDKPGVLADLSRIVYEENKNIDRIGVMDKTKEGLVTLYMVVDSCDEDCAGKLEEKFRGLSTVKEINYYLPKYGYIIPEFKSVKFLDWDAAIITIDMIAKYAYDLVTRGGQIRGEVTISYGYLSHMEVLGKAIGYILYDYINRYLPEEDLTIEEQYDVLIDLFEAFFNAIGLGSLKIKRVSPGSHYIAVVKGGAIECRGLKKYHFNTKTGYLTSGILLGFFEKMTNRRTIVEEVKCINKLGSDCEFDIKLVEGLRFF